MLVKSALNPETITGNQPVSLDSFQRFITGGFPVGQSIVNTVEKEEVNFKNNFVKPASPDINSIVQTLSSNIQSEFNNAIQNITNIIDRSVSDKLKDNNNIVINQIKNIVDKKTSNITQLKNTFETINEQSNKIIQNITGDLQTQVDELKKDKLGSPSDKKSDSYNIINDVSQMIKNATNITNRRIDEKIKDSNLGLSSEIQQIRQSQGSQVTQVQNTLSNIRKQTVNLVQSLTGQYQKKIEDIDASKPNNILEKFLDTYKNALGFIQFFGNKKNVDSLRDSLKNLVTSFTESFEVAKMIRKTIFKIVSQLSSLPKASPGRGSGINLDVKIPNKVPSSVKPKGGKVGGILKKFALPIAGGAALLGAGATSVNALEETEPTVKKESTDSGFLSSLMGIVDKFGNAINNMIGGPKSKSSKSSPGGGVVTPSTPKKPSSSTSSSSSVGTPEQRALLDAVSFAEGTEKSYGTIFGGKVVPELEKGELTVREVHDMMMTGKLKGRSVGYKPGSRATGRYQFMPDTLSDIVKSGALSWDEKFTNKAQDKAFISRLSNFRKVSPELLSREGLSVNVIDKIAPEIASFPYSKKGGQSFYSGQPSKTAEQLRKKYSESLVKHKKGGMGGLGVDPSMLDLKTKNLSSQAISQPIFSQESSGDTNLIPLDLSSMIPPQTESSGGIGQMSKPSRNPGPTVPILNSSDTSNFLTMYSKLVYNIVDG